ncbi:hypothetical protein HTY52_17965 [Cupriavidus taiwanensis]|uniref:phage tail protein n=1 Tax=Cupriavidus taiwanensis TaxID=164546 RepID=UPI001571A953|nr:phage tail protein [Cupriavidus taiwanensis]NSX15973.1 hypothetical protein [Cupriavidus taiwanensis]
MPAIPAAAVAAAAFSAAGGVAAGTAAVVAATIAYGVTYAVVSLAVSFAVGSLLGAVFKPRTTNGFVAEAQGRTQIVRSNVQPRNIVYGRAMTSGPLIYAASTDAPNKKNQYMHLVIALADHECDDIEEIYLGEDPVGPLNPDGYPAGGKFIKWTGIDKTFEAFLDPLGAPAWTFTIGEPIANVTAITGLLDDGSIIPLTGGWQTGGVLVDVINMPPNVVKVTIGYVVQSGAPKLRVRKHLGSPNQLADPDMVAEVPGWTTACRLQGVCYLYLRLEFDQDIYPNGLPNVKALVRGKKVYDPTNGVTTWSDNWGLCVYDYLRDERGFGCTDSDIDLQSVITAALISEENVPLAAGTQKRYRCNGVVMSDKSPRDNLAEMVTAGAGCVVISGGVFRLFAGAYDIPTVTLTEDDLRGPVKVQPRTSRRDLFNVVKGTFVDPTKSWQPSDFPAMRNPVYAANDGEVIERDIQLPFTTDSVMAQRIAKIILERSRQSIVVEFPAKLSAFQLTAYSTVMLSLEKFGWTNKVFRVMSWKMSADGGVDLVLNEEAAAVYDWAYGNATIVDPAPDTNLPNPYLVEPLGQITLESGEEYLIVSASGVVTSQIRVSWPPVREASLSHGGRVELQFQVPGKSDWTPLAPLTADTTSTLLSPVEDGVPYLVRGRLVSGIGVRSPNWTYSPLHVVTGKLAPPSNLTGLSLTVLNGFASLTWDAATDLDVRNGGQARIRHTTDIVQPSWASAIDIGGYISGAANSAQLPLLEGVYLAKWIDSTGNESPTAAMVITTAPSLQALNVVATIAEQPSFAGSKVGLIYDAALNGIKLIGKGLIDDQGMIDASGLWDTQPAVDTLGPIDTVVGSGGWGLIDSLGGVAESGTYTFAGSLDLGTVEKSRLTAAIDAVSFDTGDMVDFRYDFIDSWESIDGTRINDTAVSLYVRTTADNPAGAPTWSEWQRFSMGDYEARAFQWKLVLESASATHNVVVTGLSVSVDMPDRREYARDVVSAAGAHAVTFAKPFRIVAAIGITAQNMNQGDYFTVTGKSPTGFTVNFFTSAGTPVSRKFDWDAIAY